MRPTTPVARVHLRWLRWVVVAQLAFLAAQFEFGEWLSIFGVFPTARASGVSLATFAGNVVATGPDLIAHAVLGFLVFADAGIAFLLSFGAKIPWLRIVTGLELVSVASAGLGGLLFVVQGFAGDRSLFLMSTGFFSASAFAWLSLYLVLISKSPSGSEPGSLPGASRAHARSR